MNELFTTFESVSPPKIITPDVQQNYQEIEAMQIQDDEPNLDLINTFNNSIDSDGLEKPKFSYSPIVDDTQSVTQQLVDQARQFIGGKYSWGGSSPSTGFDCSGLIQYLFKGVGINLPRTAMEQGKIGEEISLQETKPGDIIWFGSKKSPSGQHIGLVSKIENNQVYIIDAAGKKLGIVERQLPNMEIKSIRRIVGNTNFQQQVLDFFQSKGLTENQSRGILGNLLQESNGNHEIVNSKSGAFGLAQWLGSRKKKLIEKYGKNPTKQQQLEFIWEELNTTEKNTLQKLLATNTISDATRVFANSFERAGKSEMNMNQRIRYAYYG